MVNQVDHRSSVPFPDMAIVAREALPEDFAEAGRVTAEAYREFVPQDDDGDWERYLARLADVGERATRTTVLVAVLVHPSVAVTVKVRVMIHPLVASRCVTFVATALQPSLAVTCAATLASVGSVAGLQPRLLPLGTVKDGALVCAVQL